MDFPVGRLFGLLLLLQGLAHAQTQAPPPDPTQGERSDGRIERPSHHNVALMVPRLVLAPFRALARAFSVPLESIAEFNETHHVMQLVTDATTFSGGNRGVRPNLDYSTQYRPTAGLTYFDHLTLGPGTDLRLRYAIGDANVMEGMLYVRPSPGWWRVQSDAGIDFTLRNDQYFDGTGPPTGNGSRYEIHGVVFHAGIHVRPVRILSIDLEGFTAVKEFANGQPTDGNPAIGDVFCVHIFGRCLHGVVDPREVPGFYTGSQYQRAAVGLRIDTSDRPWAPRSGFLGLLRVDYSHGFGADTSSYFRIHGLAGVAIHLWRASHVLLLRGQAWMVEPINDTPVPFTEIPALGAWDVMRGFRVGSIRDQSLLVGSAEYRWPIWMYADAALFVDYGGAYGKNFEGITTRQRYVDLGVGLRVMTQSQFLFRIAVAYGFNGGGWQLILSGDAD